MTREDFMRRAIALAEANVRSRRGGPFGAIVVKDGAVLAEGVNIVTSTNDPTAHAEVVAIRGACQTLGSFQLTGCELYTSCEPCPMCLGAIYWARPTAVYFGASHTDAAAAGFDDSFIYQQTRLPPRDRALPTAQILADHAMRPFEVWREQEGKILY